MCVQCLEVYTSSNDTDQDALDTLESMKEFEDNELTSYLENAALKPLDSSQHNFLQSFAGSREFYASQLQRMSHQNPMMENGIFSNRCPPSETEQREMMGSFLRRQEMLRQQGMSAPPTDGPLHPPQSPTPPPKSEENNNNSREHPFPMPGGFPPMPLPMGQYPHMMMQRPLMMFHPSFVPYPPLPQMSPYPMMPPQMIRPTMVDPHSPLMARPHLLKEQETSEKSPVPSDDVVLNDEGLVTSTQEVQIPEESSHPVGTHLVATSAPIPPAAAFQLMPTVPYPPEANPSCKNESLSKMSAPELKKPPPTPFEAKNPYDSVSVDRECTPVAADEDKPPADSVISETADISTASLLDESQNLPCRGGKPANQKSVQPRFSKNNSQRQRSRQNRAGQVMQSSTKQEPQMEAVAKPPRTAEEHSRKEHPTSKEFADGPESTSTTKGKIN